MTLAEVAIYMKSHQHEAKSLQGVIVRTEFLGECADEMLKLASQHKAGLRGANALEKLALLIIQANYV